jgi:hypothetical protein
LGLTFLLILKYDSVIHNATGLALTAWHQEDGSTITPVTYETYTGRTEQTFFFVTIGT